MNIAFFDFDGTITKTDTYTKFLFFWGGAPRLVAGLLLFGPYILAYKMGFITGVAVRSKLSWVVFWRRSVADGDTWAETYVRDKIPAMVRPDMLDKIRWHQAQGDRVVVVSASLDIYLKPWCQRWGVEVICTQMQRVGTLFSGLYVGGDCCDQEKAKRIVQKYDLSMFSRVYAYGDTPEDWPMLALADVAIYRRKPWDRQGFNS